MTDHDDYRPAEPPELTADATARMLDTVRAGTAGPRRTGRGPWVLALAAAAAAVVVVGGTVGITRVVQDGPDPVAAPAATTSAAPATTTVAQPTSTTPPVIPTTTTATPTSSVTPTTTPAAPADLGGPAPGFPPEFSDFALNGNEQLWGVYLAVAPFGDPSITTQQAALRAVGYTGNGGGTLGCDGGAAEALGADSSDATAVVYFSTKTRADQFVAAWDGPVVGTAQVTIGCNDGAGG